MTTSRSAPVRAAPRGAATPAASGAGAGPGAGGSVRIIGGTWKRTRLPVPATAGLRPTPDRVRETLFNWLGQDLSGWRVLDAFAGSGALGFEAASRGASEVVLLETDAGLVRALQASRERLRAEQLRIERTDALRWMAAAGAARFDLVMLDPPFGADLFIPAMRAAVRLVVPRGYIYLEADRPFSEADLQPHGLTLHRGGHAGRVYFHLLRPAGPDPQA